MKPVYLRLMAILLLALGARIAAAVIVGESRVPWSYEYEEIANNLLTHGEYAYSFYGLTPSRPTSFLPPVYPLFLAFTRLWTTTGDWLAKALQIGIACFTVLGLYALARELGGSEHQSILAALLMAVYPPAIAYTVDVTTVTLETFFVIVGCWLMVRAANRDSYLATFAGGVLLSLATLTRPTWLIVLPIAIVWLVWQCKSRLPSMFKQVASALLAAVITFAPWIGYNYATHHMWLLTSTNGGLNFWIGNNPQATGEYIFPSTLDQPMVKRVADWPEVARDQFFYKRGLEFIKSAPGQFLKLYAEKFLFFVFFRPNIGSNYEQASVPLEVARWMFVLAWLALIPFAIFGLFNLDHYWRRHALLIAIFVGETVVSALYFVGTRFRTPMDGFAIIWASVGILALANKRPKAQPSSGGAR